VDALRDDYHLILLDPRGHGGSDKPHDPAAYAVEPRVTDVVAVLDAAGIATAHYWGYSMGGYYGFGMAHYYPSRLRSLIIGGDAGVESEADGELMRQIASWLREVGPAGVVAAYEARLGTLPDGLRARLLASDVEALAANRLAGAERAARRAGDYAQAISRVGVPVLLYCGDRDESYPAVQATAAQLPPERMVTMAGMNHFQAMATSAVLLPHVLPFLVAAEANFAG
jgi:pimeloyl-ACP methyl ester carboxylesterase